MPHISGLTEKKYKNILDKKPLIWYSIFTSSEVIFLCLFMREANNIPKYREVPS